MRYSEISFPDSYVLPFRSESWRRESEASGTTMASDASVMRGLSPRSAAAMGRFSGGVMSARKTRFHRPVAPVVTSLT